MGCVYLMRNEHFKDGILKIGFTGNNPAERAKDLYSQSSGVPSLFDVVFEERIKEYKELEKYLHQKLEKKRVNPAREFFYTSVDEVISLIEDFKKNGNPNRIFVKNKEIKGTPLVKILSHSRSQFPTRQSIYEYFLDKIKENKEEYYLTKHLNTERNTTLWISYGTEIIGEAKVLRETKEVDRNNEFNKELKIDPKSISLYSTPISYYDYFDLQGKKPYFGTYHNVSYNVYYELTKMLSVQENIIGHRLERNSNILDVSSEEDVTWFNFKTLKKIFRKKEDELFDDLNEDEYFNIKFAIYEEGNSYWWDLAVYNNYNEKVSIEIVEDLEGFLNEISSLKNYEENYSIEDWLDEEKKYVEVVKGEKILELKDDLSWDDIIREVDQKLEDIEKRCIELLKL